MTTYEESQSLIEGQKQHSKETSKIFKMKKYKGMTLEQTSHCKKFTKLCKEMDWDEDIAAMILECTPGDILNIWKGITPIKEEWEKNLLIKKGIRLSTLRLDKIAEHLKESRKRKYDEIFETYKLPKKNKKSLFPAQINWVISCAITNLKLPLLGRGLKAFRAKEGDSQYSMADKISFHPDNKDFKGKRSAWHKVETKNTISAAEARAFYNYYKITICEAIAPYYRYLQSLGIDPYFDCIKAKHVLDTLEASI